MLCRIPLGQTCSFGFVTSKENDVHLACTVKVLPSDFYSEIISPPVRIGNPVLQQYLLLFASSVQNIHYWAPLWHQCSPQLGCHSSHCKWSSLPLLARKTKTKTKKNTAGGFLCLTFQYTYFSMILCPSSTLCLHISVSFILFNVSYCYFSSFQGCPSSVSELALWTLPRALNPKSQESVQILTKTIIQF